MIPGLIVITVLFWAWIPFWALFKCIRCGRGPISDEEKLKSGTIPYKAVGPLKDTAYRPPQISQPKVSASASLKDERSLPPKVAHTKRNREDYGIKTEEARIQKQEERAAGQRQQKMSASDMRRERQERREKEAEARRKDKGKGRAPPASGDSSTTTTDAITAPENVVTRDTSRHQSSRR